MSTLALPIAAGETRAARMPGATLAVLAWAAIAIGLREVSVDAFVAWNTLGFAAIAVRSFVRREGVDAGDVLVLFTLYYCMAMLVRGVGLLSWVDSPYLEEIGDKHSAGYRTLVGWSQLYSGLGLFAVQQGYRSAVSMSWSRALAARLPSIALPWRSSRVTPVAVGLVLLGISGAAMRVASLGGFMSAASNPMAAGTEQALGHWWQIALTEFALVGFHIHILRLLLRNDRRWLLHYLVLGIGLCGPIYLVSSSKFFMLRTLFVPWLLRHFVARKLKIWQVLLAFAGFSALFPLFYAYRALGMMNLDAVGLYLENDTGALLHVFNRAYGTDSFMLIMLRTGSTLPFQWGGSLSDLGTFWIPRMLWAGKPDAFGLQFPALYMPDMRWGAMTYVTPSLPGELYLNFHVAGVVAGGWLLGAAMRASRAMIRMGPGGTLLYCYALITFMHMAEGGIASQLETFLTDLVPALLGLALLTASVRAMRPAGVRA